MVDLECDKNLVVINNIATNTITFAKYVPSSNRFAALNAELSSDTSTSRIYVNVEDTTPPGFIYNEEKKIGRTNTNGNICRIEIGGVLGNSSQTWQDILACYNAYLGNGEYNIIDNVYMNTANDGLGQENRINTESLLYYNDI